jgi:hypothetical protein
MLRSLVVAGGNEVRHELIGRLGLSDEEQPDGAGPETEADTLVRVRRSASPTLRAVIDAVVAYERFAALADAAFRLLGHVSHSMGSQPLLAHHVEEHPIMVRAARELPGRYRTAAERMAAIGAEAGLEERLGELGVPRSPAELTGALFEHHEEVQAQKPPAGKRPWFEPVRGGRVVRPPYGSAEPPRLDRGFIHPVRVAPLRRFLADARP